MSELLRICQALMGESFKGKPKGLSPVAASRLGAMISRAENGDDTDLNEDAPGMIKSIGEYWERHRWETQAADSAFEMKALRIAALHSRKEIEVKLGHLKRSADSLSSAHLDGLDRMGNGTRPTAAAVAGEGSSGSWDAQRPWVRALEILENANKTRRNVVESIPELSSFSGSVQGEGDR